MLVRFWHFLFSCFDRGHGSRSLPAHLRLGQQGETQALRFLQALGWRVVDRNWRFQKGELDIVAWEGEVLVFVEVKTRRSASVWTGVAAVNKKKREMLRRTAQAYLRRMHPSAAHFRFDILLCCGQGEGRKVTHYKNIPLFNKHFTIK